MLCSQVHLQYQCLQTNKTKQKCYDDNNYVALFICSVAACLLFTIRHEDCHRQQSSLVYCDTAVTLLDEGARDKRVYLEYTWHASFVKSG